MTPRQYRSPARAEAAEQTRLRIIAAAATVLRAKGAGGFSLESVAKAAGVARVTVYNQFGSRRALLEAVFDERAASGGLERLAQAMADADPRAGLRHLVEIFCGFWASDEASLGGLHAAVSGDPVFEASLRERNERRRKAISVLVGRFAGREATGEQAFKDLTDLIFLLTSFQSYSVLAADRSPEAACALIGQAVEEVLVRGAAR